MVGGRYGLTFFLLHVSGLVVIRAYVCACLGVGGDMDLRLCMFERRRGLKAKQYDFESDMELRLCMFRRRLPYALTFMHV